MREMFWLGVIVSWLTTLLLVRILTDIHPIIFLFLAIFWLYGIYNLGVMIVSHLVKPLKPEPVQGYPKVAVLYTCFNDFNPASVLSLINLNYPNKTIYIIDDSTDPEIKAQVDQFASKHNLTVFRRTNRRGWKAGAINQAIQKIDAEYFVFADSDEILPSDFIQRALGYFKDNVAFVQANHHCYNLQGWSELMGVGVNLHWDHYQDYRNKYGMVQLLGHGAIIRADLLKQFRLPEIVSEDLGLTMILARHRYRGVFAKDIVCFEAFPPSYSAFRKRHKKWCQGVAELIKTEALRFLISKKVRWYEKLDTILPILSLPISALIPVFTLLWFLIKPQVHPLILAISLLTIISPMLIFHDLKFGWSKFLKSILVNTLAYGSLFGISMVYVWKGFFRASFLVTGAAGKSKDLSIFLDLVLAGILSLLSFPIPNLLALFLCSSVILRKIYK